MKDMSEPRPMNFAERLVAGPPVLGTSPRKPKVGDLVYVAVDGEVYEVTEVFPVLTKAVKYPYRPPLGYRAVTLHGGTEVDLTPREPVALTKAETKAARAHYAELE